MKKLLRIVYALDWLISLGTLALGLYWQNWWMVAGGILGLGLAYLKPAARIQAVLEKRFLASKRRVDDSTEVLAADAFYKKHLGDTTEAPETVAAPAPRTFRATLPAYSQVLLSASRHNALNPGHFNQAPHEEVSTNSRYF